MAKILSLGAGAMGAEAAKTAATFDSVEHVTVADLNLAAAEKVAAACGGKGSAAAVNVTDRNRLLSLMAEADVVMNCTGPFFRFGVPILEAAIEAKDDYLDICDDPEPTRQMHELNGKAKEAGITAIVGLGASPGITSILAARAKAELDHTDELIAGWNICEERDKETPLVYSAAIVHWMQQCSGMVLECAEGTLVEKKPLQDMVLDYPGRGKRTVYTVGHPEPVSFHYSYPGLPRSCCVMVMPAGLIEVFRYLAHQIDRGEMTLEEAGKELVLFAGRRSWLTEVAAEMLDFLDGSPAFPLLFAIARGTQGGRAMTAAAHIKQSSLNMAKATGIPLAIGLRMHLANKAAEKGVTAPEKAFDADQFFRLLVPYFVSHGNMETSEMIEIITVQDRGR